MNNLSKTRGTAYATGIIVGLASLAQVFGLADFDATTGMLDPRPFSVYVFAGLLTPVVAAGLAFVAWIKGWSRKEVKVVEHVVITEVNN